MLRVPDGSRAAPGVCDRREPEEVAVRWADERVQHLTQLAPARAAQVLPYQLPPSRVFRRLELRALPLETRDLARQVLRAPG
jgi:hypothetical protein